MLLTLQCKPSSCAEPGRSLEKAEREALEKEKAEKMRKERQNRDAFRELLLSHAGEGKIHAKLRWKVLAP